MELMIAMSVLTIGVVALSQSFGFIQKAIQLSKNRTMASNLAQEKMQILKQKPYYQILVTSDPSHNDIDFAPESLAYDEGYFPPENIMEGGATYTRYTYIQAITENSGVIGDLAPNTPDRGLKRITINVVWGHGDGKRKITLRSIVANPDTVMSNVVFSGTVLSTDAVSLEGALASLVESPGCSDTTDVLGQYRINASPGTYTLMVSSHGYYTSLQSVIAAAGTTQVTDFSLVKIDTGRIEGYPWLIDHLVISQVVGSTINTSVTPNFDQEYVEVFNPTTYTWTMDGNIGLKFQRSADVSKKDIQIDYFNDEIASGGYYLFANTTTIVAAGQNVDADAVWSDANTTFNFPYFATQANVIPVDENGGGEGGGAIELYSMSDGTILDSVGWNKTLYPAPFYELVAIPQATGLSRNELYARFSSTSDAGGVDWNYGPAYDSNDNSTDFYGYSSSIVEGPHSSLSGLRTVIAGTPAIGAVVSASDGLSASTEAVISGSPPAAYFSLVDVATGSWSVLITSGIYNLESATVPVISAGSVYTFQSTSTFLTQSSDGGIITGRIVDVTGVELSGIAVTSGGSNFTNTGPDGRYRLRTSTGTIDIIANPAVGGIATYVTASSNTIPVQNGEVHSGVDFVLYQGGRISGYITRDGINGLPGVAVTILDANTVACDQQVSDSDGRFTSVIISTGYYTVSPALGSLEASVPNTSTVTILNAGETLFSSTFTISGALGYITGAVKLDGEPIKSGVLVVVTTVTLTGSPPAPPDISLDTLAGSPFYMVSSMENGYYLAEVRGAAQLYNVYAYYSTPSETSVTMISSSAANISVVSGQTISGVDFSW